MVCFSWGDRRELEGCRQDESNTDSTSFYSSKQASYSPTFPFSRAAGNGDCTIFLHSKSSKPYFVGINREQILSMDRAKDELVRGPFEKKLKGRNDMGPMMGEDSSRPALVDFEEFLSTRLVALACGQDHFMTITERGLVFSWGLTNEYGQLGHGSINLKRNMPNLVRLGGRRAKQISLGEAHSLILTDSGEVFSFGTNAKGQCGIFYSDATLTNAVVTYKNSPGVHVTDNNNSSNPSSSTPLVTLENMSENFYVQPNGVDRNNMNSSDTVVKDGKTRGKMVNNNSDASTLSYPVTIERPQRIEGLLNSLPIRTIAAGKDHSLALAVSGEAFAWGSNKKGKLGIGKTNHSKDHLIGVITSPNYVFFPTLVKLPYSGYYSSNSGSKGSSKNSKDRSGSHSRGSKDPSGSSGSSSNSRCRFLAAGGTHSAFVLRNGSLYMCGDNTMGQLGLQDVQSTDESSSSSKDKSNYDRNYRPRTIDDNYIELDGDIEGPSGGKHYQTLRKKEKKLARNSSSSSQEKNDSTKGEQEIESKPPEFIPVLYTDVPMEVMFPGEVIFPGVDTAHHGNSMGNTSIRSVSLGEAHTIAITTENKVYGWGRNVEGQVIPTNPSNQDDAIKNENTDAIKIPTELTFFQDFGTTEVLFKEILAVGDRNIAIGKEICASTGRGVSSKRISITSLKHCQEHSQVSQVSLSHEEELEASYSAEGTSADQAMEISDSPKKAPLVAKNVDSAVDLSNDVMLLSESSPQLDIGGSLSDIKNGFTADIKKTVKNSSGGVTNGVVNGDLIELSSSEDDDDEVLASERGNNDILSPRELLPQNFSTGCALEASQDTMNKKKIEKKIERSLSHLQKSSSQQIGGLIGAAQQPEKLLSLPSTSSTAATTAARNEDTSKPKLEHANTEDNLSLGSGNIYHLKPGISMPISMPNSEIGKNLIEVVHSKETIDSNMSSSTIMGSKKKAMIKCNQGNNIMIKGNNKGNIIVSNNIPSRIQEKLRIPIQKLRIPGNAETIPFYSLDSEFWWSTIKGIDKGIFDKGIDKWDPILFDTALCGTFSCPSVLSTSFVFKGLQNPKLDVDRLVTSTATLWNMMITMREFIVMGKILNERGEEFGFFQENRKNKVSNDSIITTKGATLAQEKLSVIKEQNIKERSVSESSSNVKERGVSESSSNVVGNGNETTDNKTAVKLSSENLTDSSVYTAPSRLRSNNDTDNINQNVVVPDDMRSTSTMRSDAFTTINSTAANDFLDTNNTNNPLVGNNTTRTSSNTGNSRYSMLNWMYGFVSPLISGGEETHVAAVNGRSSGCANQGGTTTIVEVLPDSFPSSPNKKKRKTDEDGDEPMPDAMPDDVDLALTKKANSSDNIAAKAPLSSTDSSKVVEENQVVEEEHPLKDPKLREHMKSQLQAFETTLSENWLKAIKSGLDKMQPQSLIRKDQLRPILTYLLSPCWRGIGEHLQITTSETTTSETTTSETSETDTTKDLQITTTSGERGETFTTTDTTTLTTSGPIVPASGPQRTLNRRRLSADENIDIVGKKLSGLIGLRTVNPKDGIKRDIQRDYGYQYHPPGTIVTPGPLIMGGAYRGIFSENTGNSKSARGNNTPSNAGSTASIRQNSKTKLIKEVSNEVLDHVRAVDRGREKMVVSTFKMIVKLIMFLPGSSKRLFLEILQEELSVYAVTDRLLPNILHLLKILCLRRGEIQEITYTLPPTRAPNGQIINREGTRLDITESIWHSTFLLDMIYTALSQGKDSFINKGRIPQSAFHIDALLLRTDEDYQKGRVDTRENTPMGGTQHSNQNTIIAPEADLHMFKQYCKEKRFLPIMSNVCIDYDRSHPFCGLPLTSMSFIGHPHLCPTKYKMEILKCENNMKHDQSLREEVERGLREGEGLMQDLVSGRSHQPGGNRQQDYVQRLRFTMHIRRDPQFLVNDTFRTLEAVEDEKLVRKLYVEFDEEEGIDDGGLTRNFFELISTEIFSAKFGMFTTLEATRYLWFNVNSLDIVTREDFRNVGKLLGLAAYNNVSGLNMSFPRYFFKQLVATDEEFGYDYYLKEDSTNTSTSSMIKAGGSMKSGGKISSTTGTTGKFMITASSFKSNEDNKKSNGRRIPLDEQFLLEHEDKSSSSTTSLSGTLADLEKIYPEYANSINQMRDWVPSSNVANDIDGNFDEANREFENIFCLDFSVTRKNMFDQPVTFELVEGGSEKLVNYENREYYFSLLIDFLLNKQIAPMMSSLRDGFRCVMNSPVSHTLEAEELEHLLCGERVLDFEGLKKGATYVGWDLGRDLKREGPFLGENDPYIILFWEILFDYSIEQKKAFLEFVTGSQIPPIGGLKELRLKIQKNGQEPTKRLPTSHTCYNILLLPHYSGKPKLEYMLRTAVQNAEGFGLE